MSRTLGTLVLQFFFDPLGKPAQLQHTYVTAAAVATPGCCSHCCSTYDADIMLKDSIIY